MIHQIIEITNSRFVEACSNGYSTYFDRMQEHCSMKGFDSVLNLLTEQIALPIQVGEGKLQLSIGFVLSDCFNMILKQYGFRIIECVDNYLVLDGSKIVGYFNLDLSHENEGSWFDPLEPIDGYRNGSVNMSFKERNSINESEIVLLFHEMGHCIQHLREDLDTVPFDLWEQGAMEFEVLCNEYYGLQFDRSGTSRKDLAIALLDFELSNCTGINEPELIALIEKVQNYVGIDVTLQDFDHIINGQYGGVYYGYVLCRCNAASTKYLF